MGSLLHSYQFQLSAGWSLWFVWCRLKTAPVPFEISQTFGLLLQILNALDREERMLFHDRIRYLDRRILPGVTKLTWTSDKHALEFYSKEARKYCKDVELIVKDYKV